MDSDDDEDPLQVLREKHRLAAVVCAETAAKAAAAVATPSDPRPRRKLWRKGSLCSSQEVETQEEASASQPDPSPDESTPHASAPAAAAVAPACQHALDDVCARLRQRDPILQLAADAAGTAPSVVERPLVRRSLVAGGALDHTGYIAKPARWPVGGWWAERLWNVMESVGATRAPPRPLGLELQCAGLAGEVYANCFFLFV